VLPQHLKFYAGLYDTLKLAGRVTLRDPHRYRKVLEAYITQQPMTPDEIGGGPASPLEAIEISEAWFAQTLRCNKECRGTVCQEYYSGKRQGDKAMQVELPAALQAIAEEAERFSKSPRVTLGLEANWQALSKWKRAGLNMTQKATVCLGDITGCRACKKVPGIASGDLKCNPTARSTTQHIPLIAGSAFGARDCRQLLLRASPDQLQRGEPFLGVNAC
jgi:hypothetical protein